MEFDHLHIWVSNALQAANYYTTRYGFKRVAYKGLETGSRDVCTHVVRQNKITIAFSCALNPVETDIGRRIMIQGDSVKDVALTVKDATALYQAAVARGATGVHPPVELSDENGSVIVATVATFGDVWHTFIQREVNGKTFSGVFLPGYRPETRVDPIDAFLPATNLQFIDHTVANQPDLKMESACQWYERVLEFTRFWSVDDTQIHTQYSALRSIVMADATNKIKMPINEPAPGLKKSQIQEYVDFNGGPGIQHVALHTDNILESVTNLRARGVQFLSVPKTYYVDLKKRLAAKGIKVVEDLAKIEELNILVDFDEQGYLLQIFSKPVQDRPTLFYEVIQRAGCQGFGAGNFKSLFEAIERDQEERGNL